MNIAIVGGGLAGLTAAHDLARSGHHVTILEAAAETGGQARSRRERGFLIEEGAEGFVAADTLVPALCAELGIAGEVVPQVERRSLLYADGRLTELSSRDAAALLGIPVPDESAPRGLATLRDGMGTLAAALVRGLGPDARVETGHEVTRIERRGKRWSFTTSAGITDDADGVILAVPPAAAATLLAPLDRDAAALLRQIELRSSVCVTVAYERGAIRGNLNASGFVVGANSTNTGGLRACVFCSSKFANRAPDESVLLRAFFRPVGGEAGDPDEAWVRQATDAIGMVLQTTGKPIASWVARWPDAIPEYGQKHQNLMSQLELRLNRLAGLQLAGAAFVPGGVPGAVRSGRASARALARSLPD